MTMCVEKQKKEQKYPHPTTNKKKQMAFRLLQDTESYLHINWNEMKLFPVKLKTFTS